MDVQVALGRAERIDRDIWKLIDGLDLIATNRLRLSAGAFMISLDIHSSMTSLVRKGHYPTAFILSRSIWEATIRGFWLLKCATDEQLDRFVEDKAEVKTWPMIRELEQSGSFDAETLSRIHANNWPRLNAMNHVGGPLVVRCNSEDGIEYNFDHEEIAECLGHSSANALLSAIGIAQAAVNIDLAKAIFQIQKNTFAD